jgi:hypothetical protein
MAFRIETARLPAFLATAFINGDFTGFDAAGVDQKLHDEILEFYSPGRIVSTFDDSHPYFATIFLAGGRVFTGDVVDYVIHYDE